MSLVDRLTSRIEVQPNGCWEWTGWRNTANYGYLSVDGRDQCAHRVLFELVVGRPIIDGLELDHLCVNPPCVNPAHLEEVTHAENQRRIRDRQLACRRAGHDWTDPRNVRVRKNGRRYCAECDRINLRERYYARKAA